MRPYELEDISKPVLNPRKQAFNTMADFDIDNPAFEPDDWEEDIGDDDVLSTSLQDPYDDVVKQLSSDRTAVQTSLQLELLQTAVDDYYNKLQQQGLTPALGRDPGKFELVDGRLRLKAYPNLDLVNKRTGSPLSLSTVAGRPGGGVAIREELGFADWTRKKSSLPAQAVQSLQTANQELGLAATSVDAVELQDLGKSATDVADTVHRLETALTENEIDQVLGTIDAPPFDLRELRGLDRALQTI